MLSNSDFLNVNCQFCCSSQLHEKTLKLQQLPPILILHLKRFKVTSTSVRKMQNYIDYPVCGLDLSDHVAFPQTNKNNNNNDDDANDYLYDLYGVVNHYGTLNGGHYTATVLQTY